LGTLGAKEIKEELRYRRWDRRLESATNAPLSPVLRKKKIKKRNRRPVALCTGETTP